MRKYISRVPKVVEEDEAVISDYDESEANGAEEAGKRTDVKQRQLEPLRGTYRGPVGHEIA